MFQAVGLQLYQYKTPAMVISCKFCGIIQNNFFIEQLRVTVSDTKEQQNGQNKSSILFKCCKLDCFTW